MEITKPTPVIPIHIITLIRSRAHRVGMSRALKHTPPLRVHGPNIPATNPVLPIVDLKRRVRVPVCSHPDAQAADGGAGEAVGEVVIVCVFDFDLDVGGGGGVVLDSPGDGAVAVVVDVGFYVGDCGEEGGGVLVRVGLLGGFEGAEEDVGGGAGGAEEVFVFRLTGRVTGGRGDGVLGIEVT